MGSFIFAFIFIVTTYFLRYKHLKWKKQFYKQIFSDEISKNGENVSFWNFVIGF